MKKTASWAVLVLICFSLFNSRFFTFQILFQKVALVLREELDMLILVQKKQPKQLLIFLVQQL